MSEGALARYVDYVRRLRARRSAGTAVKVIVFGAGGAGALLIQRLATQSNSAYRPVAILDDDPAKRHLLIPGIPVLGGRGQIAEVAASTGATVLVIAIAGEAAAVIQDLTEAAERDESALHAIQLALHGRALLDAEETVLADIRDRHRIRRYSSGSVPTSCSTPRRSSTCRCLNAARLRHSRATSRVPSRSRKPRPIMASARSSTSPLTRRRTPSASSATPNGSPNASPRTRRPGRADGT